VGTAKCLTGVWEIHGPVVHGILLVYGNMTSKPKKKRKKSFRSYRDSGRTTCVLASSSLLGLA
jgi:hypothetical protein